MKKLLLLVFALMSGIATAQYCVSGLYTSGCGFGDDIDDFTLGSFSDLATGCSGTGAYNDFTTDTITVTQTIPQALSVTSNFSSQTLKLYIDYNSDLDFDDPGEEIYVSPGTFGNATSLSDTLIWPANSPTGTFRFRARTVFANTTATACSQQTYGEVHDYTIVVQANTVGSCPSFANFKVDSISGTGARFSWNPGSGNSSFELEYGPSGFTPGSGTIVNGTYPGSQPPVAVSGLSAQTTYDYYFKEICNSGTDSVAFPSAQQFSTTKLCASPTNLMASNVGPYSADISWSQAGSTLEFYILYGNAGFDPNQAGNLDTATASPYTLSGISPAATHDVYVVTNCGGGNGISDTVGPISFTTLCAPINVFPYLENFENATPGSPGTFPNCWQDTSVNTMRWQVNDGSTSSSNTGPAVDHTTDSTSGIYVYLETSSTGLEAFLQIPELDLTSLSSPELSFWYHMYGATMADLEVQVSTDTGASWTKVLIISGQQHSSSTDAWKQATVDISQFNTALTLIRFRGTRGSSFTGDMAIDDVEVREGPACPTPSAFVMSTTDSSATFNIIGGGSSYNIEWGPAGFTQGTGCTATVTNGVITVNNNSDPSCPSQFFANSAYDIYFQNDCGSNGSSAFIGPVSFRTQCSSFMAPYSQNFDGTIEPAVDECWTVINQTTSTSFVGTENDLQFSGTNSLELYNAGASSGEVMVVSPAFSDLDNTKQFSFFVYDDDNGADLLVGTMSDPSDPSTFSVLDTITAAQMTNKAWDQIVISLASYSGSDQYIAFKHAMNNTFDNLYIDNFHYEVIPACNAPLLTSLGLSASTTTTAEVYWTPGTSTTTNWDIQYGLSGFSLGSGTLLPVTNDTATISGLTAATSYEFYVRDSCGAGNSSSWSGPFQFTTQLCDTTQSCVFTVDLFDSFGDGWNGAEVSFIQNGVTVGKLGANFTTGSQLLNQSVQLCDGFPTYVILTTAGGWPQEIGLEVYSPFPLLVGTHTATSGTSQGDTLAMFTASCALPSCPLPTNLTASSILDTSALITWDTSANATSYQVWYGPIGFFQGTQTVGGSKVITTADSLLIDSLSEQSCYDIYLRAICTVGDTSLWTGPYSFCTPCSPKMAPYFENFDALASGQSGDLSNCWSTIGGSYDWQTNSGTTGSSNTGPQGDATSGSGIYLYTEASFGSQGDLAILQSPLVNISNLSSPELRFAYHMYGATIDSLHVDVNNGSGWQQDLLILAGQQQTASTDPWRDTLVDLSSFSGVIQVRFRAYRGSSFTGDISIDDVFLDEPLTCPQPTLLDTANVTATGATLLWTPGTSGNTSFELSYGSGINDPANGTSVLVTGSSYGLSNLSAATNYCFYVREICGPADSSFWSGPFCFNTDCQLVIPAPYSTGFEGITIGNQVSYENCWTTSGTAGLHWESEDASGANENSLNTGPFYDASFPGTAGGTYMYLETSSSGDSSELYSPYFDPNALSNPELEYYYHMYGATIEKLEVYAEDFSFGNRVFLDSIIGQQQIAGSDSFRVRSVSLANVPYLNYRIVFVGHRGSSFTGDIAIDEVSIQEASGCAAPGALSATSVGCDSITLSWNSNSGASIIEYGVSGFTLGTGTITTVVSSPFTLSGLMPGTSYDFFVADTCSGDTSAYSTALSEITATGPLPMASIVLAADSISGNIKYFALDGSSSSNGSSYTWYVGNDTLSGAQVLASYAVNGAQSIILTVSNGCGSDSDTLMVMVDISLTDNPLGRSMSLFPNPAQQAVKVSFDARGAVSVKLTDLSGKLIIHQQEVSNATRYETNLNISQLAKGVYMVEISDGKLTAVRRLIVE